MPKKSFVDAFFQALRLCDRFVFVNKFYLMSRAEARKG